MKWLFQVDQQRTQGRHTIESASILHTESAAAFCGNICVTLGNSDVKISRLNELKHKWIYGEKSNPSAGETIKILHEDKADHSGVASDQIRPPAFEDANIFANFGHQSGVVLDEILHENICLSSNAVVNTWKTNEGDDRLHSSLQQS